MFTAYVRLGRNQRLDKLKTKRARIVRYRLDGFSGFLLLLLLLWLISGSIVLVHDDFDGAGGFRLHFSRVEVMCLC